MKLHKAIPLKPTWSTDIFLGRPPVNIDASITRRLAERAALAIDPEETKKFTKSINAFAALVAPIFDVNTAGIKPLVSLTAHKNAVVFTDLVPEPQGIKDQGIDLLKSSKNTLQGYFKA